MCRTYFKLRRAVVIDRHRMGVLGISQLRSHQWVSIAAGVIDAFLALVSSDPLSN